MIIGDLGDLRKERGYSLEQIMKVLDCNGREAWLLDSYPDLLRKGDEWQEEVPRMAMLAEKAAAFYDGNMVEYCERCPWAVGGCIKTAEALSPGDRIKELMKHNNMTEQETADIAGMRETWEFLVRNGDEEPELFSIMFKGHLQAVADALGVCRVCVGC